MDKLDAIFAPKSVAVIGASTKPGKVGHDIFVNILKGNYQGTLYPVNPTAKSIQCVRAYPAISDIPDPVDLGIIILPPPEALKAVMESARVGIKGIVIVSAGFKEVGGEGRKIEEQITAICREAGMRLVGPNCLGVINPHPAVRLNASFSARMPAFGEISFISQSGALCTAVLDFAADRDFGFSKFISIGNKADVDELDLLRYFHKDKETEVIMIYLEELRRGADFIQEVREMTSGERPTPILVIKSGRTSAGAAAAASHTGSLAGSEGIYEAIFQQSGIIRAESIEELFNFAEAFSGRKIPNGKRVAIITNAGGPGIVATDMTVTSGLKLARLSEETIETLASHLPATANVHNPVDVIGDASQDRYENALGAVIRDANVDGALVILTPQSMTNALGTAEAIVKIAKRSQKPILCCFMGIIDVSAGVKHLQENGIPVFRFPEHAAQAFAALYRYSKWTGRQHLAQFAFQHDVERAAEIIRTNLSRGRTYLADADGNEILRCYGFPTLPTFTAKSREEALDYAESMGGPVAMKIISPQIVHKTDAGGVMIGVKGREAVIKAYDTIIENATGFDPNAVIEGVLVQRMAEKGEEVILGMSRFPGYGPLLMFGLGGVLVEVFKDVAFRLAPIGRNEARRLVKGIKGRVILKGYRGRPPCDTGSIERCLVSLSDLSMNHPEIKEMDINPFIVYEKGKGAVAADCRIILEPPAAEKAAR
ncbi:acetate--CoA ligase alpha subunit [Syntrophobacter fumaroxidans]|uniref:CoA-binding domain protein n=1 Tax=Syntrophobacter fumaroxidans (strain DSM 10017 / MPOB) TaxID=335543 RepID=A0LJP9_SYNFM|nr:acetate--CoA ligase [Syntrophobacter fumaroxidans]ABK17651.1 CoA-binding domain protein [Syntrophobacter fumaroxidans MPOB]